VSTPLPPSDWRSPIPIQIPVTPESQNGDVRWFGQHYRSIEPTFVERPLLQSATFHLLTGRPSVGKGALCMRWLALCTGGTLYQRPRNALLLASEEDPDRDLMPRMEVAGVDPMRVAEIPPSFLLPRDIEWLRRYAVEMVKDVGLIVLDPISNHMGGANSNADEEVRNVLQPLALLAGQLDAPIIGIRHVSTKEATGGFVSRILGSTAWSAVPRVVLGVGKDDEGTIHVRPVKGNRVRDEDAGMRFRLEGIEVPGWTETVVRAIDDGASEVDIDTLLGTKRDKTSPSLVKQTRVEIVRVLRERGGEALSDIVDTEVALRVGVVSRTVQNQRTLLKQWGWIGARPERDGEKIRHWLVFLKNSAPYDHDLEAAVEDPLGYIPRAHAHVDTPGSDLVESSLNLPQNLSLLDSTSLDHHPGVSGTVEDLGPPLDPPPTAPPPPLALVPDPVSAENCPTCGSTDVGVISGRCHACGEKVRDGAFD
jgi:hypothetical protein